MPDISLLTTMTTALCAAYPDEAWLVRDTGRLIKVELPHGTHTLCQYVSWTQAELYRGGADGLAVIVGQKLIAWREAEGC